MTALKPGNRSDRTWFKPFGWQLIELTPHKVAWWHATLCAVAVLNLILWVLAAIAVTRGQSANLGDWGVSCKIQLLLSAGYVFGCAYRSMLPVYDIPRIVLVDSRLSNIIVGRSVATIAELCFAAQWALILHQTALLSDSMFGQAASLAIVPLIVLAEGCSWNAVLTTDQRGHIAENAIWGFAAALVVAGMLVIGPHKIAELYPPMVVWCVAGTAYVAFMFLFDVPMYWSRWVAGKTAGRRHMSIFQGLIHASRRRVVSYRWEDWKSEVVWMSLYFSFGVWSSMSVVYATLALSAQRN